MRELRKLYHRHTNFMYSIAESVHQEVVAPIHITDDVFLDFLIDNEIRDVHERIARPNKNTLLHSFIINLSNEINYYAIKKFPDLQVEYFEELISCADYESPGWLNEDEISDHKDELSEMCCKATEVVAPTVFHLLFSDRNFLFEFQKRISEQISSMKFEDCPELLKENGVFKRIDYIPSWLQRAIFFRDQGRCQLCSCEISGLSSPNISVHLDHMVPLAAGGSNDPTNFQLTCGRCNTSKGKKVMVSPAKFEPYW